MEITVDMNKCIGNGLCAALDPEHFAIAANGDLLLLSTTADHHDEDVRSAALSCPMEAILLDGAPA